MMNRTDNFSKTIKVGRIASISDLRTDTSNGKQFIRFTLAVNKDKDKPDYYPCIAFNATCRYIDRYISVGNKVVVIGSDSITLKKMGKDVQCKSVQIIADSVYLYESDEAVAILNAMQNIFFLCAESSVQRN